MPKYPVVKTLDDDALAGVMLRLYDLGYTFAAKESPYDGWEYYRQVKGPHDFRCVMAHADRQIRLFMDTECMRGLAYVLTNSPAQFFSYIRRHEVAHP